MTTITSTEAGATGRYIDLGISPANNVNVGAQTIIVYAKPTGSGGGGFAYFIGKTAAGSINGLRFFINHNAGAPCLNVGSDSSGNASWPNRNGTANEVTYNSYQHYEVTYDGSVNFTGFNLYVDGTESTYGTGGANNGSGTINSDSARNLFLMNRGNAANLGREFVGDVAYIARWNRVLSSTERTSVRNNGPLSVPSGLILCWVNQADLSTNAITPAGRSTHVDGSMPSNTALGDATNTNLSVADAAHAHAADNVVLTTDSTLAVADAAHAHAADNVTLDIGGSTTLAINDAVHAHAADNVVLTSDSTMAVADAAHAHTADNLDLIGIADNYERSSVNPALSTISGTGDSAIISIKPRKQESEVVSSQTRWLEPSAKISGLNGFRPTFKFLDYAATAANGTYHGAPWQATRRPMFSYDQIAWTYFDTQTVNTDNIEFRHNTAFAADTVYISRGRQTSVAQTGDWLDSMLSAYPSLIGPADSAASFTPALTGWPAQSFIADEFSSQTNELGKTIPATPFYAAQINDASLMPASGFKRLAVIVGGVHAGEDHGEFAMRKFVEFALGNSAEAQNLRRHYRILIYSPLNAPGRAGGGWRGSFTQGVGGADDANRHFSDASSGLEIVTKPRAAMVADMAGAIPDWMLDWHGTYGSQWSMYVDPGNAKHTEFHTRLATASGFTVADEGDTVSGFVSRYFQDTAGSALAITIEHGDPSPVTDANLATWGAAVALVLSDMRDAGFFGIDLAVADATHAHAADNVVLTTDSTLAVADAAHNQSADNVNLSLTAPAGTSPGLYRPSMYPVYPPAQSMFRLRGEESPAEFGSFSARTELTARILPWQIPEEYGRFRNSSRLSLAMTGTEDDDDMVAAFHARRMPSPAQMQKTLPHLLRALNSIDAL